MLRFAISPTDDMSIAKLREAIFNYIVSQQKREPLLVRIDDIESSIEGKDTEIMMILEKFAIKHNMLYHQTQHLNIYQNLAFRLFQEKKAFKDDSLGIYMKSPKDNISRFIIIDIDKKPTHIFASTCDDMLSGINFIIKSKEEIDNSPKEIYIKSSLGYKESVEYIYLPTIDTNYSIIWLLQNGFIPDAIINYLILLGNSKVPKEIFTLPEAIEWFDLKSITSAKFDIDRLKYINQEHLKRLDDKSLSKLFGFADSDIGKLAKVYLGECSTINELKDKIDSIFTPKNFDNRWGNEMKVIQKIVEEAPTFNTLKELKQHIKQKSGLKDISTPLNILLTGCENEPKLDKIYPLIKSYILEVAS